MSLIELFFTIFTYNILTFGGGMTMFPLLDEKLVQQVHLLTPDQLLYAFAIARVTPGQANLYVSAIGYLSFGTAGAIVTTLAIVIPSFLMIPVMHGYEKVKTISHIKHFIKGVTVASIGLIASAVTGIGQDILVGVIPWLVFICVLILSKGFRINGIISFVLASTVGVVLFFLF